MVSPRQAHCSSNFEKGPSSLFGVPLEAIGGTARRFPHELVALLGVDGRSFEVIVQLHEDLYICASGEMYQEIAPMWVVRPIADVLV